MQQNPCRRTGRVKIERVSAEANAGRRSVLFRICFHPNIFFPGRITPTDLSAVLSDLTQHNAVFDQFLRAAVGVSRNADKSQSLGFGDDSDGEFAQSQIFAVKREFYGT